MKPGDIIQTWSDMAPFHGEAIVVASSRSIAKAGRRIEIDLGQLDLGPVETWRTVTKALWDSGECPDEIDGPGDYWSGGDGAAWIQVRPIKKTEES